MELHPLSPHRGQGSVPSPGEREESRTGTGHPARPPWSPRAPERSSAIMSGADTTSCDSEQSACEALSPSSAWPSAASSVKEGATQVRGLICWDRTVPRELRGEGQDNGWAGRAQTQKGTVACTGHAATGQSAELASGYEGVRGAWAPTLGWDIAADSENERGRGWSGPITWASLLLSPLSGPAVRGWPRASAALPVPESGWQDEQKCRSAGSGRQAAFPSGAPGGRPGRPRGQATAGRPGRAAGLVTAASPPAPARAAAARARGAAARRA